MPESDHIVNTFSDYIIARKNPPYQAKHQIGRGFTDYERVDTRGNFSLDV